MLLLFVRLGRLQREIDEMSEEWRQNRSEKAGVSRNHKAELAQIEAIKSLPLCEVGFVQRLLDFCSTYPFHYTRLHRCCVPSCRASSSWLPVCGPTSQVIT